MLEPGQPPIELIEPIETEARMPAGVPDTSDNHPLSGGRGSLSVEHGGAAVQPVAASGAVQSIAQPLPARSSPGERLSPEIMRYLRHYAAPATARAYRGDVADFVRWGGHVPCDPTTLARYVAERAEGHRPSTVARRVVGIGRAHVAFGFADPSKDPLVQAVLRGVRRAHGSAQRRAAPLLLEDLLAVLGQLPCDRRGCRDRALLLLGFACGLRRSEIVQLDVADLRLVPAGLQVRLTRSKTDQEGVGRVIGVPHGRSSACPVAAVREWLLASGINDGPVFRAMSGNRVLDRRLSDQSVSLIVKAGVAALGRSPEAYSGHSLRAGFVTSAAQAGVGFLMIQQQTGHRSVAMLGRYVRGANLFDGNAAGALL